MPKLHRHQATRAAETSIPPSVALTRPPTAQIGRAWRCLLRACRRSDEVSGHEGKGYRAGTGRTGDHPKRVMPKLHRHQATRAAAGCADPVGSPGQKLPLIFGPKWTLRFPKEAGARLVLRSLRRNERGDRRRHPARIMHPVQVPTGAASRLQNLSSKVHVLRNVSKRPRLDRWLEMSKRRRAAPLSTSQVSKLPMRIHPAICDALKCEGTHASPVH